MTKTTIPSLCSDRLLTKAGDPAGTLYFLLKNPKKTDLKLVLRNRSSKVIQAEFEVIKDKLMAEHFDVLVYPSIMTYQINSLATVQLIIKAKGTSIPVFQEMRCVVVSKLKNSSVKFGHPCVIRVPSGDSSSETE